MKSNSHTHADCQLVTIMLMARMVMMMMMMTMMDMMIFVKH